MDSQGFAAKALAQKHKLKWPNVLLRDFDHPPASPFNPSISNGPCHGHPPRRLGPSAGHPIAISRAFANKQRSPLLRLPFELRSEIWKMVAANTSCLPLIHTCRQTCCEVLGEIIPFGDFALINIARTGTNGPALVKHTLPLPAGRLESLTIHVEPTCDPGHSWLRFEARWLRDREEKQQSFPTSPKSAPKSSWWDTTAERITHHIRQAVLDPEPEPEPEDTDTPDEPALCPMMWYFTNPPEREQKFAASPDIDRYFFQTSTWVVPSMDSPLAIRLLMRYRPVIINIVAHAPPREGDQYAAFMMLWAKMHDVHTILDTYNKLDGANCDFRGVFETLNITLKDEHVDTKLRRAPFWCRNTAHNIWSRDEDKYHMTPYVNSDWRGVKGDKSQNGYYWEVITSGFQQHRDLTPRAHFALDWPSAGSTNTKHLAVRSSSTMHPDEESDDEETAEMRELNRYDIMRLKAKSFLGLTAFAMVSGGARFIGIRYYRSDGTIELPDHGAYDWYEITQWKVQRFHNEIYEAMCSMHFSTQALSLARHLRGVGRKQVPSNDAFTQNNPDNMHLRDRKDMVRDWARDFLRRNDLLEDYKACRVMWGVEAERAKCRARESPLGVMLEECKQGSVSSITESLGSDI